MCVRLDITQMLFTILNASPIGVQTQLEASEDDSLYGWSVDLEEGFALPESIWAAFWLLIYSA